METHPFFALSDEELSQMAPFVQKYNGAGSGSNPFWVIQFHGKKFSQQDPILDVEKAKAKAWLIFNTAKKKAFTVVVKQSAGFDLKNPDARQYDSSVRGYITREEDRISVEYPMWHKTELQMPVIYPPVFDINHFWHSHKRKTGYGPDDYTYIPPTDLI